MEWSLRGRRALKHLFPALRFCRIAIPCVLCLTALCPVSTVNGFSEANALKVIVLTDAAGLGDKGFNDVCWQGVLRAKKDFGHRRTVPPVQGTGRLRLQYNSGRRQGRYCRHSRIPVCGLAQGGLPLIFRKPGSYISKAISRLRTWQASISGPRKADFSPGSTAGLFTQEDDGWSCGGNGYTSR